MATRLQIGLSYKTMTKRAFVRALRAVFTASFPEEEFRDLRIVTEFPLTKVQYPAIYIRFNEGPIQTAGVGHSELFRDPKGQLRKWSHSKFEGTVDFVIVALSPLSRDILSDVIIDILRNGRLSAQQREFYDVLYGEPGAPYSDTAILSHVNVNTDEIRPGGESSGLAPWQPEDVLVYSSIYTVDVMGEFYNTLPISDPLTMIGNVSVRPYPTDLEPYAEDFEVVYPAGSGDEWTFPMVHYDDDVVRIRPSASAAEVLEA